MNQRILEIAKTAGLKFPSETALSPVEIKFAELIIQECAMKAIGAKIRGESIDVLIDTIKEDFGVE